MTLDWREEFDEDDNSIWSATGPYSTEPDEPPDTYWRIRQRLSNNRIEWYSDHDAELNGDGDFWLSLEEAKAAIAEAHEHILRCET